MPAKKKKKSVRKPAKRSATKRGKKSQRRKATKKKAKKKSAKRRRASVQAIARKALRDPKSLTKRERRSLAGAALASQASPATDVPVDNAPSSQHNQVASDTKDSCGKQEVASYEISMAVDPIKTEVENQLKFWVPRLLLREWKIKVIHAKEQAVDDSPNSTTLARMTANPNYLCATLTIYPAYREKDRSEREDILVHELCHCLSQSALNVMTNQHDGYSYHKHQLSDEMELLTQRIANVALMGRDRAAAFLSHLDPHCQRLAEIEKLDKEF